tara:strand:- start:802 stop:1398 length:597 start_codon:yes stop_codon:yes gene_type:complete
MTKTFVTIAAVAMLSTAAFADDFGNTNLTVAVEGTDYGMELSANETHRSFEVHTTNQPLAQYAIGMTDNDSQRDWSISATPRLSYDAYSVANGISLYIEPKIGVNWGDSHDETQLELSPTIGASYAMSQMTPYAELMGQNTSVAGDILDIEAGSRTATVGTVVPLNDAVDFDISMVQTMDSDWNNSQRELSAKFSIKF